MRRKLLIAALVLALLLFLAAALYRAAVLNYHALELRGDGSVEGLTLLDVLDPAFTDELLRAAAPEDVGEYVVSTSTGKFHRPDCEYAARIKPENRDVFTDPRDFLLELGLTPCGVCQP